MSDRGRFEHAVRITHHGRSCARCTQFYTDEHGEVHPIRGSPGYSTDVEDIQKREKHRREREAFYGHERKERMKDVVVVRPPWAAGLSERHLLTIARAHGQSAGNDLWWEKANLVQGSGELRYALAGRSTFDRRRRAEAERAPRKAVERVKPRGGTHDVWRPGAADLPF